jgi:hypothetical protein
LGDARRQAGRSAPVDPLAEGAAFTALAAPRSRKNGESRDRHDCTPDAIRLGQQVCSMMASVA